MLHCLQELRLQRQGEILIQISSHNLQKVKGDDIGVWDMSLNALPEPQHRVVVHSPAPPKEVVVVLVHNLVVRQLCDPRQDLDGVVVDASTVVQMSHHWDDKNISLVWVVSVLWVET